MTTTNESSKSADGGPASQHECARCGYIAARYQGHQWLCAMHYRFGQMRASAKRKGKTVPTVDQLQALVHPDGECRDCGKLMTWLAAADRCAVVTLQHYRDGSFGLVCRSCNTRHAFMPGDTYRDLPAGHKFCPHCLKELPFSMFSADRGRSGEMKLKSWCKSCSSSAHRIWREARKNDAMLKARG
ncbi:hypothetical protein [Burkholderia gladioli]|uniref:hypothetical protein n=1 Tax=Burkholderia gladioli TaxID=28095 RepID=UPI0016418E77|nr:hypothetical protein [Burkholderia gladioli]